MDELELRVQTGYTIQKLGRGREQRIEAKLQGIWEEAGCDRGHSLCKCPEAGLCWAQAVRTMVRLEQRKGKPEVVGQVTRGLQRG